MIPDEAAILLIRDLRLALMRGDTKAAVRRLGLFEMMQFPNGVPMAVTILRTDDNQFFVCDEYAEDDYGRVHVMGDGYYANFDKSEMTLDYRKTSVPIAEICYVGNQWPDGVEEPRARGSIMEYFGYVDGKQ